MMIWKAPPMRFNSPVPEPRVADQFGGIHASEYCQLLQCSKRPVLIFAGASKKTAGTTRPADRLDFLLMAVRPKRHYNSGLAVGRPSEFSCGSPCCHVVRPVPKVARQRWVQWWFVPSASFGSQQLLTMDRVGRFVLPRGEVRGCHGQECQGSQSLPELSECKYLHRLGKSERPR